MSVEQKCTNLCHNNSFVLVAPTHLDINNTCNFVDSIIKQSEQELKIYIYMYLKYNLHKSMTLLEFNIICFLCFT